MQDRIYCARCEQELDPEAFAPSQRRDGRYCRACTSAYQKAWYANQPPRPRKQHVRRCIGCNEIYTPWNRYKHPGAAGPRCQPCYLAYQRDRYQPKSRTVRASAPLVPGTRPGSGNRLWRALQADVLATETHCGICHQWVDKSLHHYDPMSPTIDHIEPVSYGGGHERANLRLAHRACNADAGRALPPVREVLLRAGLWMSERMNETAGHSAETAGKISPTQPQDPLLRSDLCVADSPGGGCGPG
jgi:hypothetical protein